MSFAFIQSSVVFEVPLPFQLTPRFSLAKATDEQIATIKALLKPLTTFLPSATVEYEYQRGLSADGIRYPFESLPPDQWRYWVIQFDGHNGDLEELGFALLLLRNAIELGFVVGEHRNMRGHSMPDVRMFHFYNDMRRMHAMPVSVTKADLERAGKYFDLVVAARKSGSAVFNVLQRFWHTRSLPPDSDHQVLSCFATLEALLTRDQKDVADSSLTHQLKTKLVLVDDMLDRKLDYSAFPPPNDEEDGLKWKRNIWTKLYSYRSCIAHGNNVDFPKDFKRLGNQGIALAFLREATKLVLILALEKPDFVQKLRAV